MYQTASEIEKSDLNITIAGTVQQISPKNVVITRWGYQVVVANTTVADATGTILFQPGDHGEESDLAERLARIDRILGKKR